MEHRLSATELVRKLGDVLGRIRYRGDSFVVERNGEPVARISPLDEHPTVNLREAFRAWKDGGEPDPDFADALEEVGATDQPPETIWGS